MTIGRCSWGTGCWRSNSWEFKVLLETFRRTWIKVYDNETKIAMFHISEALHRLSHFVGIKYFTGVLSSITGLTYWNRATRDEYSHFLVATLKVFSKTFHAVKPEKPLKTPRNDPQAMQARRTTPNIILFSINNNCIDRLFVVYNYSTSVSIQK
jgi:hypothetical protein